MKNILFSILILLVFTACEFDQVRYNVGNDFLTDPTRVVMIDTLTVKSYTIVSDSSVTSRSNRLLTGISKDFNGIETYCESYFMLSAPPQINFRNDTEIDSAVLILHYDGYYKGDTSKVMELSVHELNERITIESDGLIYNNRSFSYSDQPLGSGVVNYKTNADSLLISMSSEFTDRIFDLVYNDDELLDGTSEDFYEYFNGMAIVPISEQPTLVAGFLAHADSVNAPKVRFYYHDNTVNDNLYFDMKLRKTTVEVSGQNIATNVFQQNFIENKINGTVLEELKPGEYHLPSELSGNMTYIQGGVNIKTKIEIPYIDNLYDLGIGSLVSAQLSFQPIEESFDSQTDLPQRLEMFIIDEKNRNITKLTNFNPDQLAYGELMYNPDFTDKTRYEFDITPFAKDEYISKFKNDNALALTLQEGKRFTTIDNLIIGSPNNKDNPMELKVYLTLYNNF